MKGATNLIQILFLREEWIDLWIERYSSSKYIDENECSMITFDPRKHYPLLQYRKWTVMYSFDAVGNSLIFFCIPRSWMVRCKSEQSLFSETASRAASPCMRPEWQSLASSLIPLWPLWPRSLDRAMYNNWSDMYNGHNSIFQGKYIAQVCS